MCFFILPHGIVLVNWCLLMSACKNLRNTRLPITKHGWGCHGTRPPIGPEVALSHHNAHLRIQMTPVQQNSSIWLYFCQDHLHKPIYIYIFLCQYIDTVIHLSQNLHLHCTPCQVFRDTGCTPEISNGLTRQVRIRRIRLNKRAQTSELETSLPLWGTEIAHSAQTQIRWQVKLEKTQS